MNDPGVGDLVVYGAHGAGTVEARETRRVRGEDQTVLVIALADGLSVQLPLSLAREQLRPVVGEADIAAIGEVLRETPPSSTDPWQKRQREAQAKLGDAVGLAEIIRDGHARGATAERGSPRLAPSERELVRRARTLLATEIAAARGSSVGDADDWIARQLS